MLLHLCGTLIQPLDFQFQQMISPIRMAGLGRIDMGIADHELRILLIRKVRGTLHRDVGSHTLTR
jgi:hypothetical protein